MDEIFSVIYKGMMAGLIATIALSVLMILQSFAGILPDVNVIAMLADIANEITGLPASPFLGWVLHVVIGVVLGGGLFALAYTFFPGRSSLVRGLVYAVMVWLLMMVAILPMGDLGFFGTEVGGAVPVIMLILHLLFGAILGFSYEKITTPEQRTALSTAPPGAN